MVWPLPPRTVSDLPLNTEIIAVLLTISVAVFVLSYGADSMRITRRDHEATTISPFSLSCVTRALPAIKRRVLDAHPSVVGQLLASSLVASFVVFCLLSRMFTGGPVLPKDVCVDARSLLTAAPQYRRIVLHPFYVSDNSILYWVAVAPVLLYACCSVLEPVIGIFQLAASVLVGIPLVAFSAAYFMPASECFIGIDFLVIALCVMIFLLSPKIYTSNSDTSTALPFPIMLRWVAAIIAFGVLLMVPTSQYSSICLGGLLSGIILTLPCFPKIDFSELSAVISVNRRSVWTCVALFSLCFLPFSFARLPKWEELYFIATHFKFRLTFLRGVTEKLIEPFPPLTTIVFESPLTTPLALFCLKFSLLFLPLSLFSRQKGLTYLAAVSTICALFFGAASHAWRYPNIGAVGAALSVYQLLRVP